MAIRSRSYLSVVPRPQTPAAPPKPPPPLPVLAAQAIDTFEQALGGRQAFIDHLSTVPDATPEIGILLRLIADPARLAGEGHNLRGVDKLSTLCEMAKISPGEVFAAFRDARIATAHIESLTGIANRLKEVTAEVLKQALPHEVICSGCDGLGETTPEPSKAHPQPIPRRCRRCRGTGWVTIDGDLESQKLVLELAQLIKRDKGTSINLTQQTASQTLNLRSGGAEPGSGSLEALQQFIAESLASGLSPSPESVSAEGLDEARLEAVDGEVVKE